MALRDRMTVYKLYRQVFQPAEDPEDPQSKGRADTARRVLADLWDRCLMNKATFVPNDPTGTAYQEGRRSIMLHILRCLDGKDLEKHMEMERQNQDNEELNNA